MHLLCALQHTNKHCVICVLICLIFFLYSYMKGVTFMCFIHFICILSDYILFCIYIVYVLFYNLKINSHMTHLPFDCGAGVLQRDPCNVASRRRRVMTHVTHTMHIFKYGLTRIYTCIIQRVRYIIVIFEMYI